MTVIGLLARGVLTAAGLLWFIPNQTPTTGLLMLILLAVTLVGDR